MQPGAQSAPALIGAGVVAGLAGAVIVDTYLIAVLVFLTHATSVANLYRFVASGAIGKAAFAEPGGVYLGVALHVLVSLAWALGYAYVAARTPQVLRRPLLSGVAFGFVVMISMQLVEVAAGIYTLPTTATLANDFVAHTLFFGIPVAYIVSARLARLRA